MVNRTSDELSKASEHLHYEVSMLKWTSNRLADGQSQSEMEVNAVLESFTVHARALYYFFHEPRKYRDDVVADDFMQPPLAWNIVIGTIPAALADVRARVNKEIVHLSYARLTITPEAKLWNITAITEALLDAVDVFVKYSTKLGPSWPSAPELRTYRVPSTSNATNSPIMVNSIAAQKIIGDDH